MRKFTAFLLLAVASVYFELLDGANAQEKTCKSVIADLTKRQLGGISKCTKTLKFKNGKEKSAKSTCILKCVLMNEGVLNADGGFTEEGIHTFINKEFAESDRENILTHFKLCVDDFGALIDPKEEFCKSYDPIIKCLTSKMAVICS